MISVNPKTLLLLYSLIEGKNKRIALSYLLLSIAITLSKVLLMLKLVVSLTMMLVLVAAMDIVYYSYEDYITPTTITLRHVVKFVGLLTQDNLAVSSFVPFVMS